MVAAFMPSIPHPILILGGEQGTGKTTAVEEATLDHKTASLGYHIDVYVEYLRHKRGKGNRPQVSPKHIVNVEHNLRRVCDECHFQLLRDINLLSLERWAKHQLDGTQPLSARSLNAHLSAVRAFGNWCVISKRLVTNPVSRIPRMDEKSDPRRPRRALADDECHRLLHVAQLRPLAEYGRAPIRNPVAKDQGGTGVLYWRVKRPATRSTMTRKYLI